MLSIGIVGLPNVGKSTLFQAITKKQVPRENYPFCTIDPNIGVVAIQDERVDKIAVLLNSAKQIYPTIEFVDIAGLVKGAHCGEGLGNQFLAHIRETDAILYILRGFVSDKIINIQESVDILREKEILDVELLLKDLETATKRLDDLQKDARAGKKEAIKEWAVLNKAKDCLAKGRFLSEQQIIEEEKKILKSCNFLSLKPRFYLLNASPKEVPWTVIDVFQKNNWSFLIIDILTELETADLTSDEKEELGLPQESPLRDLIKKAYNLLGLITFFSTVSNETRGWTIKRGCRAPQAGGVIHGDFEDYFIKAEVINWQDLISAGGFFQAKAKGLIRTEGKDYEVQDGDVLEIKAGK